ncbi:DUF6504 family protein [Kineococcus radiotolerans]|uniref:DUF6504 family protein n=1 Tax=Kineococcus radiotolerans TaxID=131568 RepID=UPI00193D5F33|nr:DUF6504 family protein [Kineococcus radiotolerans]
MTAVRRFSDEVHVRCGARGEEAGVPALFVWRGRLYVVREVLSRWRERSAWWEHAAVAAVHGDEAGGAGGAVTAVRPVLEIGDLEREVFRVEAGVGRAGAVGVYDLARPVALGTAAVSEVAGNPVLDEPREWQLLRVSD